jgi:hypothetical protein
MSAAALGTEAVGSWLRRIAKSVLPTAAAAAPPEPPAGEPTPMDAAFTEPEPGAPAPAAAAPDADAAPAGEPARPASTAFSLDQIFGGQPRQSAPAEPPKHSLGASFDEFFGAAPPEGSAKPKEGEAARGEGDDLSAFNAWLHGLKG